MKCSDCERRDATLVCHECDEYLCETDGPFHKRGKRRWHTLFPTAHLGNGSQPLAAGAGDPVATRSWHGLSQVDKSTPRTQQKRDSAKGQDDDDHVSSSSVENDDVSHSSMASHHQPTSPADSHMLRDRLRRLESQVTQLRFRETQLSTSLRFREVELSFQREQSEAVETALRARVEHLEQRELALLRELERPAHGVVQVKVESKPEKKRNREQRVREPNLELSSDKIVRGRRSTSTSSTTSRVVIQKDTAESEGSTRTETTVGKSTRDKTARRADKTPVQEVVEQPPHANHLTLVPAGPAPTEPCVVAQRWPWPPSVNDEVQVTCDRDEEGLGLSRWKGRVAAVQGDQCRIRYSDLHDDNGVPLLELAPLSRLLPELPTELQTMQRSPGDCCEVLYEQGWWPAKILSREEAGFRVLFTFPVIEESSEPVPPERIRPYFNWTFDGTTRVGRFELAQSPSAYEIVSGTELAHRATLRPKFPAPRAGYAPACYLVVGNKYEHETALASFGGGGSKAYQTGTGGVIKGIMLDPEMNPDAPERTVLHTCDKAGGTAVKRQAADKLTSSGDMPLFLRDAPNSWIFHGFWKCDRVEKWEVDWSKPKVVFARAFMSNPLRLQPPQTPDALLCDSGPDVGERNIPVWDQPDTTHDTEPEATHDKDDIWMQFCALEQPGDGDPPVRTDDDAPTVKRPRVQQVTDNATGA